MITNREVIKVAAKWWADQLRGTKFDNGEPLQSMMGEMLQSAQKPIEDVAICRFQTALEKAISDTGCPTIAVDYHPDKILCDAGEVAGIKVDSRLPWKTCMIIKENEVLVAFGYGAPFEPIYKRN